MKSTSPLLAIATAFAFTLATFTPLPAQAEEPPANATVTATTGVITEKSSASLVVNGPDFYPVRYLTSSSTNYVDEDDRAVSTDQVKNGTPVVIHSHDDQGKLVASKVIVRRISQALPTRFDLTMKQ